MTGIETNAQALWLGYQGEDAGQMLKPMTETATLPCRGFDEHLHAEAGTAPVYFVKSLGYPQQAALHVAIGR